MTKIDGFRSKVNDLSMQRAIVGRMLEEDRELLAVKSRSELQLLEAQSILSSVACAMQQKVHDRVSSLVTRCLSAVFDDPYLFSIRFDRKRGKTEAKFVFSRRGVDLDDPLDEVGGGVVDVAAFAVRLSVVMMVHPPVARVLVLDEPFKNVRGEENKRRTRELLVRLSKDLDIQFIISTDIPAYRLGTVIEMGDET